MSELFRRFAARVSAVVGTPAAFVAALFIILIWLVTGPFFGHSDTWQLAINTLTTISTFLMVFLLQNSQNRDARAIHLKLDELIIALKGASDELVDIEDVPDAQIERLQEGFKKLHEKYEGELAKRKGKRN